MRFDILQLTESFRRVSGMYLGRFLGVRPGFRRSGSRTSKADVDIDVDPDTNIAVDIDNID